MKNIFFTLIIVLFCGASAHGQADSLRRAIATQQGKEMMDTYSKLVRDSYETADKQEYVALMDEYEAVLVQEMRRESDPEIIKIYNSRYAVKKLNYAYYLYNMRDYQAAENQTRIGLQFCLENDDAKIYYYMFFDLLLELLEETHQYETFQSETLQLYEGSKARDDIAGMSVAAFSLARFYKNQSRWAEAEEYYRESIELFNQQPYREVREQLTEASRFLVFALLQQEKHEEALQALLDYEQAAIRLEDAMTNKDPFDPVMKQSDRIYLSMYYARYYMAIGDIEAAERYCDIAENAIIQSFGDADYTPWNLQFYLLRARVYAANEQYEKALEAIDRAIKADIQTPPNMLQVRTLLNFKTRFLILAGKASEAIAHYDSLRTLDRQACMTDINAQVDEIRTIYEVDKITAEKERIRNNMLFAIAGCILLTIIVFGSVYYSRLVWNKNRGLYKQIKEQDRLADELKLTLARYDNLKKSATYLSENNEDSQNRSLIEQLYKCLMSEKYYAKQKIDINELAAALKTNRTYIQNAVKAITGNGFQEYVFSVKMNEAKKLLETTDYTIETIVDMTGFKERTFYKLFVKRYNLSPTDFRKVANK